MISYNKERKGWDFQQATEDEKEVLVELAEAVWANAMATAIAKKWMEAERQALAEAAGMSVNPADKSWKGLNEDASESAEIIFPEFGGKKVPLQ